MYNSSVYEQKAAGVPTGSLDHIRPNDTGMEEVESFILFSCTQRRRGANKRERPLKCNLGLVFYLSCLEECADEPLVPWQGRRMLVCKRVYVNVCLCLCLRLRVSVKY